jgi:hypothetical protein
MSPKGYRAEQTIQFSPDAFPEQRVRVCVPCNEAGVRAVATRLVAVGSQLENGRRKTVPMCTRHAQTAWKPVIGCVSEITLEDEIARRMPFPEED